MYAIDTVLRDEYLNLALRHAARAFVEPARGEGTRIAWRTAAAGYGSSN
jgi:hypothetical protein